MENTKKKKHNKKLRKIVMLLVLCTVILSVSTYAWFIGMKTVDVQSFDIKIATTEGLFLSLNGKDWSYDLNLAELKDKAYEGNANVWLDGENEGLIPMSTVGDMDDTASRMKLYEKGSLTAIKGGARLLTSRVDNYTNTNETSGEYIEGDGYVAFDLFIKNLSGNAYYSENEPKNEEAIYLTTNSQVINNSAGEKSDNTGIENSLRVGFAQIGRVENDESKAADDTYIKKITGINCTGDTVEDGSVAKGGVTGICRSAQIWEPNDTKHVQNALNYYKTNCLLRTGDEILEDASYGEACDDLSLTTAYPTFAVSRAIQIDDKVNIYDGDADTFNKYAANSTDYKTYSTATDKSTYKLVNYKYFTDTDKMLAGTARPQFMSLAPNSITKVRVYIWLEGQDIDNYDFASLGQKVAINFGFTKEQFINDKNSTEPNDEFDYDGPDVNITDQKPEVTEP